MKQETKEMKSDKYQNMNNTKYDHATSMENKRIKIAAIKHL